MQADCSEELQDLLGNPLCGIFGEALSAEHHARVVSLTEAGPALGWAYFAPSAEVGAGPTEFAIDSGIFELVWIGISPSSQRSGLGSVLLADFEAFARASGAHTLVV